MGKTSIVPASNSMSRFSWNARYLVSDHTRVAGESSETFRVRSPTDARRRAGAGVSGKMLAVDMTESFQQTFAAIQFDDDRAAEVLLDRFRDGPLAAETGRFTVRRVARVWLASFFIQAVDPNRPQSNPSTLNC